MKKTTIIVAFVLGISITFSQGVSATLITRGFTGTVTTAYGPGPNIWALLVADTFTGSVTYDDTLLTGNGPEVVSLGSGSLTGSGLSFVLGTHSYTEKDDSGYSTTDDPELTILDGVLMGFNFIYRDIRKDPDYILVYLSIGVWSADDDPAESGLGGTFSFDRPDVVPEPSTIALMSIGIVGLLGVAARKKIKNKRAGKS